MVIIVYLAKKFNILNRGGVTPPLLDRWLKSSIISLLFNSVIVKPMNSALRARLKQARKNTKTGKALAKKTKKFRKNNYWPKPKGIK